MTELERLNQRVLKDQLFAARVILLVVGATTFLFNLVAYYQVPNEVEKVFREEIRSAGPDEVLDEQELTEVRQEAARHGYWIYGWTALTGLGIFLLGIFLYKAPVLSVVTGLLLYAGCIAFLAFLDFNFLKQHVVKNLVIFLVLGRAVQTAFAYRKEIRIGKEKVPRTLVDIPAIG